MNESISLGESAIIRHVLVAGFDFRGDEMAHIRPELLHDFLIGRNDLEIYAGAIGVIPDGPNQRATRQRIGVVERRCYADFHRVTAARFSESPRMKAILKSTELVAPT